MSTWDDKIPKVWGFTEPLIVTPMFELHKLSIKPFHRCSTHVHHFKHNAFYILHGTLYIDMPYEHNPKREVLEVGHTLTIAPGVRHQFRTGNLDCVALEMYYTEPLSADIVRYNIGSAVNGYGLDLPVIDKPHAAK